MKDLCASRNPVGEQISMPAAAFRIKEGAFAFKYV
jgi:hypothetical protein